MLSLFLFYCSKTYSPWICCNSVVEQCTVAWKVIGSAPSEETKIFRLEISEASQISLSPPTFIYTTINFHSSSLIAKSSRYFGARFVSWGFAVSLRSEESKLRKNLIAGKSFVFLPALSGISQSACVALQDEICPSIRSRLTQALTASSLLLNW